MTLGAFSISLNVKDIYASIRFYQSLGFKVFGGEVDKNFVIMKNGHALIGLFQGMFANNILTFNPGWNEEANAVSPYDDVRQIQQQLKQQGLSLITEADDTGNGPANFMLADPDGNVILIDQHV